jgi:hypothetical protein
MCSLSASSSMQSHFSKWPVRLYSGMVLTSVCGLQVQMLCNLAHVYWQHFEGSDVPPLVCDADAARSVLDEALELSTKAEGLFRGERWSNPGLLYMAVIDACQSLGAAGCDTGDIEKRASSEVDRVAKGPCRSVGVLEPLSCWTPELQARWESLKV